MNKRNRFTAGFLTLVMLFALAVPVGAVRTQSQPAEVTGHTVILHTNDVHGSLDGYAEAAAVKKAYEDAGASVLLLDAGGALHGSPVLADTQGSAAVELMNLAGYDAAVPGCQDLSYGQEAFSDRVDQAKFPFLAANLMEQDQPVLTSSQIFTLDNGVKVGVFGLVNPATASNCPDSSADGLSVLNGDKLVRCAQTQADDLNAKGCDIVIGLGHLGRQQSQALLEQLTGVDAFIDGHDHDTLRDITKETNRNAVVNDILLTSAGNGFEQLGVLEVDPQGDLQAANVPLKDLSRSFTPNAAIQAKADALTKAHTPDPRGPIGTSELELDGTPQTVQTQASPLGSLLCDSMIWQSKTNGKTPDMALLDAGSIGASLPAGEITDATLNAVIPKDQNLVWATVSGKALREALESATRHAPNASANFPQIGNMIVTLNTGVPFVGKDKYPGSSELKPSSIQRVISLSFKQKNNTDSPQKPFDPKASYTIVTTEAIAKGTGAYGAFRGAKVEPLNATLRQSVAYFIPSYLSGTISHLDYGQWENPIQFISYHDVYATDWFANDVSCVTLTGHMQGDHGFFHPNQALNRAMMVTVLYRMHSKDGEPEVTGPNPFQDVPNNAWYTKPVLWAYQNHITTGINDTTFGPMRPLTREQLATFFYRFTLYENDFLDPVVGNPLEGFKDANKVSPYAREPMAWAVEQKILNGIKPNELAPQHTSTRAQLAAIVTRYTTGS